MGMACADVLIDKEVSILAPLCQWDASKREAASAPLIKQGCSQLQATGHALAQIEIERSLELRYKGQSYELGLPESADPAAAFAALHERRYGWSKGSEDVELVCLRVRCCVRSTQTQKGQTQMGSRDKASAQAAPSSARSGERPTWIGKNPSANSTPCFDRARLLPGHRIEGPAVIEEFTGTTLVPPGWEARVLPAGHLWMQAK